MVIWKLGNRHWPIVDGQSPIRDWGRRESPTLLATWAKQELDWAGTHLTWIHGPSTIHCTRNFPERDFHILCPAESVKPSILYIYQCTYGTCTNRLWHNKHDNVTRLSLWMCWRDGSADTTMDDDDCERHHVQLGMYTI